MARIILELETKETLDVLNQAQQLAEKSEALIDEMREMIADIQSLVNSND